MNKNVPKLRFKGFEDEWIEKRLGELDINLIRGPFGSALKKECMVPKGENTFKVYEQKHAIKKINNIGEYYIDKNKFEELKRFSVNPGDFIMSCSGTIGEIFKIPIGSEKGVINQALLKIEIGTKLNEDFFLYCFKKNLDNLETKGSGIKNITSVKFLKEDFLTKIPSLEEQEKIADFFTILDSLIEEQEGKVRDLEIYKKGMMQKIFKQEIRFKDDNGLDYPEWEEKRIKDIGVIMSGIGFSEKYQGHKNLDYKIFKVSDMNLIGNEKVMTISNNTISEEIVKQMKASLIEGNSIIFAKVGAAIFLERKRIVKEKFLIDNNMMAINIYNNNNLYFCYYILNSLRLSKYAQIGALPSYNSSDIGSIKIKIPIFQEQTKIANFLSNIDNLIEEEQKNLDDLREMKKGLLQQMFV